MACDMRLFVVGLSMVLDSHDPREIPEIPKKEIGWSSW